MVLALLHGLRTEIGGQVGSRSALRHSEKSLWVILLEVVVCSGGHWNECLYSFGFVPRNPITNITGCHLCNKPVHEISSLLDIQRSTASVTIKKWKYLGTKQTQPRSGRPSKVTEKGH